MVFRAEDKLEGRMSWAELNAQVSQLQQVAACARRVVAGDRVAAIMPNAPETIVGLLAAASIGAVFSSCSPDFGVKGVMDRFGQIEPKVLIACDGYYYNAKRFEIADKLAEIVPQLPSTELVLIADYLGESERTAAALDKAQTWDQRSAPMRPARSNSSPCHSATRLHHVLIGYDRSAEMHRSFRGRRVIAADEGTCAALRREAGRPRLLLHHLRLDDVELAGCGPRLRSALLLFDGSPFAPDGNVLFDYAQAEGMTFFGTSAKYIDALKKPNSPARHA